MAPVRGPTTASISGNIKVPSTHPSLVKALSRLSRSSLINLALKWLETDNNPALDPYLESNRNIEEEAEEDYLHTPAKDIQSLRQTYEQLKMDKGAKRDIIDRILDGDWRRGVSLQQLAMVDLQYLEDNDSSLRWTALKLVNLADAGQEDDNSNLQLRRLKNRRQLNRHSSQPSFPQIKPATFVSALSLEISSLVKAHYHLHTLPAPYSLPILRLYVSDSPYSHPIASTESLFLDSARTLYVALPNSCPYIYVALSGAGASINNKAAPIATKMDIAALKKTVLEAIPKALSRPQERYALEATDLTAKSLSAICQLRGNGKGGACGGAFTIFQDGQVEQTPLDVAVAAENDKTRRDMKTLKRKSEVLAERDGNLDAGVELKKVATRFGVVGLEAEEKENEESKDVAPKAMQVPTIALDRVCVRLEEGNPDRDPGTATELNLTFRGNDVFGGLRQLAELGGIDMAKMPSWMTGEEGSSNLTVSGRVVVGGKAGGA